MSRSDLALSTGIVVFVALLWIATFWANTWLDPVFFEQTGISWLFLPAGIRLMSVAVFRWDGVIGLFAGALVTSILLYQDPFLVLATALQSALSPLIALLLLERSRLVQTNLARITPLGVIAMCLVFAAVNALLGQGFFLLYGVSPVETAIPDTIAMFVGDLAGSFLVVSLISVGLRLKRNANSPVRESSGQSNA